MMGRTIASRGLAGAWVFFPGEVQRAGGPLVGLRESVHRELRSTKPRDDFPQLLRHHFWVSWGVGYGFKEFSQKWMLPPAFGQINNGIGFSL